MRMTMMNERRLGRLGVALTVIAGALALLPAAARADDAPFVWSYPVVRATAGSESICGASGIGLSGGTINVGGRTSRNQSFNSCGGPLVGTGNLYLKMSLQFQDLGGQWHECWGSGIEVRQGSAMQEVHYYLNPVTECGVQGAPFRVVSAHGGQLYSQFLFPDQLPVSISPVVYVP
jgi:hypothetical protein